MDPSKNNMTAVNQSLMVRYEPMTSSLRNPSQASSHLRIGSDSISFEFFCRRAQLFEGHLQRLRSLYDIRQRLCPAEHILSIMLARQVPGAMGEVGPAGLQFFPDEPKPAHSYIGLIAMAILGSADRKLVLSDIYQWILDNYPYFRNRGPGWRNSIRHNLSLNDCFVKSGRSANGKGHYWAVHPANVDDFQKGDFPASTSSEEGQKSDGIDRTGRG